MHRPLAATALSLALVAAPLIGATAAQAAPGDADSLTATISTSGSALTLESHMKIVVSPSVPIDIESFSPGDVTTSHGVPVSVTWGAAEGAYTVEVAHGGEDYEGTATATFNTSSVTVDGVPGPDRTVSTTFEMDTIRPTATIHLSSTDLRLGHSSTVTIETSEPVTGLSVAALTVPNGRIEDLSESGRMWTGTFVPDPDVSEDSNAISLDDAAMHDAYGNAGEGPTVSEVYAVRTTVPSAGVSVSPSTLGIDRPGTVTVVFSEAVTGFEVEDMDVPYATASELGSADGGTTWTALLTPDTGVTTTGNQIELDTSRVVNAYGNRGRTVVLSGAYTVDTERPTAVVDVSRTTLALGDTATVTAVFSEPVTGVTDAAFRVVGGEVSGVTSGDGVTWTGTLVPDVDVETAATVVQLDAGLVRDGADNAGAGVADSPPVAVDTRAPTAAISVPPGVVTDPMVVSVVFSEPVTGFTLDDLTAPHGTLSDLVSADGGTAWTVTFTPDADVSVAGSTIRLDLTGIADLAGNNGSGGAQVSPFAIDTTVVAPPAPVAGTTPAPSLPQPAPAAGASVTAAATPRGELPRTGTSAGQSLVVAGAVLGLGVVLVRLAARGRRPLSARRG